MIYAGIVARHHLLDRLLANAVVSKVVELLVLVVELALLQLVVHFRNQVCEGSFHV